MAHLGPQEHSHEPLGGFHQCKDMDEPEWVENGYECKRCGGVFEFYEPEHPYGLWEEATVAKKARMLKAVKEGKSPGDVK